MINAIGESGGVGFLLIKTLTRAKNAHKHPVCAHRAPSRAGAEKDPQIRHGMPVSDQ